MTRFLLRLLLLAVFFNTAIGAPAHEATHLAHLAEAVGGHVDEDGSAPDDDPHGACEWCHACTQAFAPGGPLPSASTPPVEATGFALPASDTLVRCARPRSFASRDPPPA